MKGSVAFFTTTLTSRTCQREEFEEKFVYIFKMFDLFFELKHWSFSCASSETSRRLLAILAVTLYFLYLQFSCEMSLFNTFYVVS